MEGLGCIALLIILKSGAGSSRWTQGGRGVPPTATIFGLATTGSSLKRRRPSSSSCGFGTGARSIDFQCRQADIQCGRASKIARGFAPWNPTGSKPPNPRGKEVNTHGVSVRATRKPTVLFRPAEVSLPRFADRRSLGTLTQAPPRKTRTLQFPYSPHALPSLGADL